MFEQLASSLQTTEMVSEVCPSQSSCVLVGGGVSAGMGFEVSKAYSRLSLSLLMHEDQKVQYISTFYSTALPSRFCANNHAGCYYGYLQHRSFRSGLFSLFGSFPYRYWDCFFHFSIKYHWDFDGDCTEFVYHFLQCSHFQHINSAEPRTSHLSIFCSLQLPFSNALCFHCRVP